MASPTIATIPSVTIGGRSMPLPESFQAVEAIAPQADSASLIWPLGAWVSATEPAAAPREAVVITCGSWTWNGWVERVREHGDGARRTLTVEAIGLSAALERCYLASFTVSTGTGTTVANRVPAFRMNRSDATTSVGGSSVYYSQPVGSSWTRGEALASLLAHASVYAGLPAITVDDDDGVLDADADLGGGDLFGLSMHACVDRILPQRLGIAWRLLPDGTLRIRRSTGTEDATPDLTVSRLTNFSWNQDGSGTLSALQAVGGEIWCVESLSHYTAGGNGSLSGDWSDAEATASRAGELTSPGLRRFVFGAETLADSTDLRAADPIPGLPCSGADAAEVPGPWMLFGQLKTDSSWVALNSTVGVSVVGRQVWIDGSGWPALYDTFDRLILTGCFRSSKRCSEARTGGAGSQRGLILGGGGLVLVNAYLALTTGGSLIWTTKTLRDDRQSLRDLIDGAWSESQADRRSLTWTIAGEAGASPAPLSRIAAAILPATGGEGQRVVETPRGMVTARTVSWKRGDLSTTWTMEPRIASGNAVAST